MDIFQAETHGRFLRFTLPTWWYFRCFLTFRWSIFQWFHKLWSIQEVRRQQLRITSTQPPARGWGSSPTEHIIKDEITGKCARTRNVLVSQDSSRLHRCVRALSAGCQRASGVRLSTSLRRIIEPYNECVKDTWSNVFNLKVLSQPTIDICGIDHKWEDSWNTDAESVSRKCG